MKLINIIKDKKNILILILIIFAIIIRIVNWPNTIPDINCDEAMLAINARSIAETGKDIYGTSFPVYFEAWLVAGQSALPTYITALFIKCLGFNIIAIRLPILIISILAIFIIYKLAKELFNKEVALIALFLIVISPWQILQSQWNLDCNFFPHIILFSIYSLVLGIKRNNSIFLYLSMILFAMSMYSYGISIYFVLMFLIIFSI